jgi:7,8-dihydropterin-6-yl-methyl-4-(beta-D-ribofuranosyl)aminobenzene 5'-phosphate synthase
MKEMNKKPAKIVILSDNRTNDPKYETEHGLSIYMETLSGEFLLDTGASDLFIRNAEIMGIDLANVDYCLLSHGHNDHIGGLPAFLQINQKARIILSADIPGAEYISTRKYRHSITGNIDFTKHPDRFIFINDNNTTIEHIHVYANIAQKHSLPLGNRNLLIRGPNGEYLPDTFHHELAFVIDEVLFTGCAHNGIINILDAINEHILLSIGGFHLLDSHLDMHYESKEQLQTVASYLTQNYPEVRFYTGHCTGNHSLEILTKTNNHIHQFQCGDQIIIK